MTVGQSSAPEEEFVEALVELQASAAIGPLVEWCAERGIDVVRMAAGALLTGSGRRFAEAFGEPYKDRSQPWTLPVPAALRNTARSITVLPVPTPGTRGRTPD
ncbi:hypothetical protein [Streptomyces sp. NPDC057582]|uniref:hypothetical protein n=1 Tax=Streptomyces sp. NPDC057582 TaxID=3346174 RepID=UPI0036A5F795